MSILCSMVGATYVAAVAEIIRSKKGIQAIGNASISTSQSQFGGSSAYFDGTDDYLIANGDFSQTGDFTIEGWFRFNRVTGAQILMTIGNESTERAAVYTNGSTLYYDTYSSGTPDITCSGTISTGVWYHIAAVRSGSTITVYRDGTSVGTGSKSGTVGNATNAYFGADSNSISDYQGWMDEIRYSNTARYTANFTPSTTPFVNDANTLLLIHCDGTNASTTFFDDNGTGRNQRSIQAIGNAVVSTAQSKFGGSSYLSDGTGDALRVNQETAFGYGTGAWTIEFFIRPTTNLTGTYNLWDQRADGAGVEVKPSIYITGNTLFYYTNGDNRISYTQLLSANTWYHIAISKSGSSTRMFLDGTQVGSTYTDNNNYATSQIIIGAYSAGGGGYSGSTPAYFDEIRVSNIARYTANFTSPTEPFVNDANTLLLLHCDGTNASTVFRDDNGEGRASKSIRAIGNAQIDTAQSQFGGSSLLLDGTGDYLIVPTDTDLQFTATETWTVELWFRTTTISRSDNILAAYNLTSPFAGWGLQIHSGNDSFAFWDGSAWRIFNSQIVANTWYHVAIVSTAGSIKMYQNGVQQTTTSTATSNINNTTMDLYIGARSDGLFDVSGWIDELRISNSARYAANFTPSTTPFQNDANTLLLLHMDGTDTSTVFIDDNGTRPT